METPRTHGHAGETIGPRLHRVAVEDVAIKALAEHQVAERFERIRILLPLTGIGGGCEGLGSDDRFPIDVSDARAHFYRRVTIAAGPEFSHHHVRGRAALERFERAGVGFDCAVETVL